MVLRSIDPAPSTAAASTFSCPLARADVAAVEVERPCTRVSSPRVSGTKAIRSCGWARTAPTAAGPAVESTIVPSSRTSTASTSSALVVSRRHAVEAEAEPAVGVEHQVGVVHRAGDAGHQHRVANENSEPLVHHGEAVDGGVAGQPCVGAVEDHLDGAVGVDGDDVGLGSRRPRRPYRRSPGRSTPSPRARPAPSTVRVTGTSISAAPGSLVPTISVAW